MPLFGNYDRTREADMKHLQMRNSIDQVNCMDQALTVQRDEWGLKQGEGGNTKAKLAEIQLYFGSNSPKRNSIVGGKDFTNAGKVMENPLYLIFDLSSDARTSFVRRVILDIFIYTYSVPINALDQLPDETWCSITHTTRSLLSITEHNFLLHIAHLVQAGMNLATTENTTRNDNRLTSHEYHTIYTYIVEPCKSLDLSSGCLFDLLHLIPRHNFTSTTRYKTLPHQQAAVLMYLVKHNRSTIQQRYKLSKRLLSDAAVLVKIAESMEMWATIGFSIRIFGGKHMGREWEDQVAEDERDVIVSNEAVDLAAEIEMWKSREQFEKVDGDEQRRDQDRDGLGDYIKPFSAGSTKIHFRDERDDETWAEETRSVRLRERKRHHGLPMLLEENEEEIDDLGSSTYCERVQRMETIETRKDRKLTFLQEVNNDIVEYRAIVEREKERSGLCG